MNIIYIYVYMYIAMYICTCTVMCIYTAIQLYMCVYTYLYIHTHIHVHAFKEVHDKLDSNIQYTASSMRAQARALPSAGSAGILLAVGAAAGLARRLHSSRPGGPGAARATLRAVQEGEVCIQDVRAGRLVLGHGREPQFVFVPLEGSKYEVS